MKEYIGGCHCGEVKFSFLSEESVEIWKCNCSICDMLDYEHLFIKHDLLKIISGKDSIEEYLFKTETAKHFFCKLCGIKSFYQPRSHPDAFSVNLKCVENPPEVHEIIHFDGLNFCLLYTSPSPRDV